MVRYPIAILALLLVFFGCAGITEFMPRGGSAADSAQVVILRNRNMFGSGRAVAVMLDEKVIAKLAVGQYIQFWVPPGRHIVRTTGFAIGDSSVAAEFRLGESYYFVISPSREGMEIEAWPAHRALKSIEGYGRLEVE